MDPFELGRVELLHFPSTDEKMQWFVLNVKICGVRISKFLSSSPLVARFPSEFSTVQLSDLKNGGSWMGDMFKTTKWPSPLYLELFLRSSGRNLKKEKWQSIVG